MLDEFQRMHIEVNPYIKRLTYIQFNMKYASSNEEPQSEDLKLSCHYKNHRECHLNEDLNLIVTHDFSMCEIHNTLPKCIRLVDLRPGEPKYMKKKSRCVIRFHKID